MSTHLITRRPLTDINVKPGRARKTFDNVQSLAQSIKDLHNKPGSTTGLINPVIIVKSEEKEGKFDLVAGERRFRAHMILAMEDPRFLLIDTIDRQYADPVTLKEVELLENVERSQLNWMEEAENLRQIHELKIAQTKLALKEETPLNPAPIREWTTEKTAELVGLGKEGKESVKSKVRLAEDLKRRPDIKEKIKHLPASAAMREFERIEGVERVEKLNKEGKLKLVDDLHHGDCVQVLQTIPSDSIDLVLTDPPFGIGTLSDQAGKSVGVNKSYTGVLKPDDNSTEDEVQVLMEKVLHELFRVLKPSSHSYIFHSWNNYQFLVTVATKIGFHVEAAPIIWYKGRATSGFTGYSYAPCYELILFLHKPPRTKRLTKEGKTLLEFSPPLKEEKLLAGGNHPFQKPVNLLTYLIGQSTRIGDKVLDPFSGSASTGVASIETGRCYIGIEKDRERFISSQERLKNVKTKNSSTGEPKTT